MGTMVEAGGQHPRCATQRADDGDAAHLASLASALVTALEGTLGAAYRLLDALNTITDCRVEAVHPPEVVTVPEMGRPQRLGLSLPGD